LYGRLTGAEIELILEKFDEIWSDRAQFCKDSPEATLVTRIPKLARIPNWVSFYQLSLVELLGRIVVVAGVSDELLEAAKSDNPRAAAMDAMKSMPEEAPDHPDALPAAFAMIGNLDAIARYSRSINDMLSAASNKQDANALFQALSVDSYISSMAGVQALLRLGQLYNDPSFASAVFAAIRGPHKARKVYAKLRWAEYLLRDQGAFESCSQEEIHDLVVNRLKIYDDDTKKKDSKKALSMLFRKWQKEAGN
jgi:hypothetical protein